METAVSAPAAIGTMLTSASYRTETLGNGHIRVTGHEVIGNIDTGNASGLAGVFDANPACWVNSRLALVARAYERYRYNKCTIQFVPAVGSNTSGVVATAVELDPDELLPTGDTGIQRALNSYTAALTPVWQPSSMTFSRNTKDHQWYLASQIGESSRSACSQFLAYALYSGSASGPLGRMVFHYDIEFLYPELELASSGSNFSREVGVMLAGAAGTAVTYDPTSTALNGAKIVELRLPSSLPSTYVTNPGDWFDYVAGAPLYAAFAGSAGWLLYATLDAAKVGIQPLKWTNAFTAVSTPLFQRILINSLNFR